jgi:hypothetical protein
VARSPPEQDVHADEVRLPILSAGGDLSAGGAPDPLPLRQVRCRRVEDHAFELEIDAKRPLDLGFAVRPEGAPTRQRAAEVEVDGILQGIPARRGDEIAELPARRGRDDAVVEKQLAVSEVHPAHRQ